jgi:hypothetical protein
MKDKVIELVCNDLQRRSEIGIKKYNTTLDRKDLHLKDWLQHAYEECLDQANYLKRSILELESNHLFIVPENFKNIQIHADVEIDDTLQKMQLQLNFDEGEE